MGLMYDLVMLIHYPDIQEKVYDEIQKMTEGKDFVAMSDKECLPYTDAFINEVWRFCNIFPIHPKLTSAPLKLDQYEIPVGTDVLPNTYTVHMDSRYWGDPEKFRPERFLSGGKFQGDERNIPFGIGKRRCLGEAFAR